MGDRAYLAGVSIMLGAWAWVIPPAFPNPIIAFRESFVRSEELLDRQTARTLHVEVVRYYPDLVDQLMNPRMPTVVNTDGDPIAPTTLEFELRGLVAKRLVFTRQQVESMEALIEAAGRERLDALLAEFAWRAKTTPVVQPPDIIALRATLRLDHTLLNDATTRKPSS